MSRSNRAFSNSRYSSEEQGTQSKMKTRFSCDEYIRFIKKKTSQRRFLRGKQNNCRKKLAYFLCNNIWLGDFLFYHKTCFLRKPSALFIQL